THPLHPTSPTRRSSDLNNTAMQINLDAFEKAGVPVPSQDPTKTWTWDQFAEACKLISQKTSMKGFLMSNGGDGGWDAWLFHAWLDRKSTRLNSSHQIIS